MPNDLLGQIHSSTDTTSPDWATFRGKVTGMYLLSGQGGEWDSQHLIREYNRNINSLYKSWTPTEPNATGLFLEPYNAGFSYQGTGDFRDYKWDTYSVAFDGTDDYIRGLEDATVLDFIHTGAALSFWINLDAFPCTTQSGEQYWGNTGDWPFDYKAFFTGFRGTKCWMALQGVAKVSTDVSSYITAVTWHHICMVADAGTATYYIDGIARDTMSYTPDAADNPDAGHFDIAMAELFPTGIPAGPMPSGWVAGKFDEVAIFKGALSAAQVLAIYNGGTPQSLAPYNPFAWWRMGDGPLDDGNIAGNGLIGDQVNPTLGSELITDFTNGTTYPLNTLVTNGRDISSAIESSNGWGGCASNALSITVGEVYKVSFNLTHNSGVTVKVSLVNTASGSSGAMSNLLHTSTDGVNTVYLTATGTDSTSFLEFSNSSGANFNFAATDISCKLVNGNAGRMENMTASDIVADTP